MAPEALTVSECNLKSDIWSFGCLLVEIFSQSIPFPEMDYTEVMNRLTRGDLFPTPPEDTPPLVVEVIEKCCNINPDFRPNGQAICEMLDVT